MNMVCEVRRSSLTLAELKRDLLVGVTLAVLVMAINALGYVSLRLLGDPVEARVEHRKGLLRLFEIEEISSALIFTKTRMGSDELAGQLSGRGYSAEALNG